MKLFQIAITFVYIFYACLAINILDWTEITITTELNVYVSGMPRMSFSTRACEIFKYVSMVVWKKNSNKQALVSLSIHMNILKFQLQKIAMKIITCLWMGVHYVRYVLLQVSRLGE